jgi:MFS family permease
VNERARARLLLVCAVSACMTIGIQAVLPAMPLLQDVFGISDAAAGWFTLAFTLPGLVLVVPLATLVARLPRRATVAGLLIGYGVLGLAQAFVGGYAELLVLRVLQGAIFAAVMPLMLVIVGEAWAASEQIGVLARRATWVTGGELVFPLAGALLATVSWRLPFVAQILVAGVAVLALVALDDRRSPPAPRRRRSRLVDVVREQPHGYLVMGIGFARFLFKFSFMIYLPLLLVEGADVSVVVAGLVVTLAAGATGVVATAMPRVLRRVRPSRALVGGALSTAAALAGLALTDDPYLACAIAVAFGIGDGVLVVLSDGYVLRVWPAEQRPRVSAASQAARNLGKVAAPLVMSAIAAVASITAGFGVLAVTALLFGAASLRLRALDDRFTVAGAKALAAD